MTPKGCAIIILILLIFAADAAQAQRINLLEAYRMAEQRDPQLAAARQQKQAQIEQVPQARALLLPQIDFSANANRVWEDVRLDDPIPTGNGMPLEAIEGSTNYNTANIGINLRQMIFRREAFIALRQARIIEDQADANFQLARQQLGLQVAEAYFAVVEAEDTLRTFEAELRAVENELSRSERRYELGVGGIIEVNDAQARHASTRASLVQSRSQLRLAYETLRRKVSAPVEAVTGLPKRFTPEPPQPKALANWIRIAEDRSLEVRIAEYSLDVSRAGVEASRSERYPQLDLVASLQRDYQGENPVAGGIGIESDRAAVGVQFSIPLFTGGDISARVRQSIAERETRVNQLQDARRSAALAAESAFIALESSCEQITALEEALEAVRLAEKSSKRGLELGQRTMLDLLNVQRERFQVARNLSAARYQYMLSYLQLRASIGEPLDDAIIFINNMLESE